MAKKTKKNIQVVIGDKQGGEIVANIKVDLITGEVSFHPETGVFNIEKDKFQCGSSTDTEVTTSLFFS